MNQRQWRRRVLDALCWTCNVPLERVPYLYAHVCPTCGKVYPERIRRQYAWDIQHSIDGFGKSFWSTTVRDNPWRFGVFR